MNIGGWKIDKSKAILSLLYFIPIVLALIPSLNNLAGYVIALILIYLCITSECFYFILPFVILYSTKIFIFGMSLNTIYALLIIVRLVFTKQRKIKIQLNDIIPGVIIFVFLIISVAITGSRTFIILLISNLGIALYAFSQFKSEEKVKEFLNWFLLAMIGATIYGFITMNNIHGAIYTSSGWVSYNRFRGTFEDMNYWGFFSNIAIGITLLNKSMKNVYKIVALIILYAGLFATASMTAYLCQFLVLLVVLMLNKVGYKKIVLYIGMVLALVTLFYIAGRKPMGVISDAYTRFTLKFEQSDSIDSFTTGRSDIWLNYLNFYGNQNILKMLFGFNIAIPAYNNTGIKSVPHQEHITWLVNTGIVGMILLEYYSIKKLIRRIKLVCKEGTSIEINRYFLITTVIWFFYSFGLTMFTDFRFLTFFLL